MPKADGDPRAAHGSDERARAGPGADESAPARGSEVREDRKLAEELLAGFVRPSRSLHVSPQPVERDFVGYYAKKPSSERPRVLHERDSVSRQRFAAEARRERGLPTVVKVRAQNGLPRWLMWLLVGIAMLFLGTMVAWIGTKSLISRREPRSTASGAVPTVSLTRTPTGEETPTVEAPTVLPGRASATPNSGASPDSSTLAEPRQKPDRAAAPSPRPTPSAHGRSGHDESKPIPREDFFREL